MSLQDFLAQALVSKNPRAQTILGGHMMRCIIMAMTSKDGKLVTPETKGEFATLLASLSTNEALEKVRVAHERLTNQGEQIANLSTAIAKMPSQILAQLVELVDKTVPMAIAKYLQDTQKPAETRVDKDVYCGICQIFAEAHEVPFDFSEAGRSYDRYTMQNKGLLGTIRDISEKYANAAKTISKEPGTPRASKKPLSDVLSSTASTPTPTSVPAPIQPVSTDISDEQVMEIIKKNQAEWEMFHENMAQKCLAFDRDKSIEWLETHIGRFYKNAFLSYQFKLAAGRKGMRVPIDYAFDHLIDPLLEDPNITKDNVKEAIDNLMPKWKVEFDVFTELSGLADRNHLEGETRVTQINNWMPPLMEAYGDADSYNRILANATESFATLNLQEKGVITNGAEKPVQAESKEKGKDTVSL